MTATGITKFVLPEPSERRTLRSDAGRTLAEVGEAVGVSASAVSRWERGKRKPQRSHRMAYVAVLRDLEAVGHD